MPLYEGGPLTQFTAFSAGVIPNDVFGVAINWFVNRTPLVSRLPKLPTGSPQFLVTNDNYRPRSNPMNNGGTLSSSATSRDGDRRHDLRRRRRDPDRLTSTCS